MEHEACELAKYCRYHVVGGYSGSFGVSGCSHC